jgi:hypothetical protein
MADVNATYKARIEGVSIIKLKADGTPALEPPMYQADGMEWNGPFELAVAIEDLLADVLTTTVEMGWMAAPDQEKAKIARAGVDGKGKK